MIINLPWIEPIDTQNLPENFEGLVKKAFENLQKSRERNIDMWTSSCT